MTDAVFSTLLRELVALPGETEWVEFKCNNEKPEDVGEHLSALANSATLHRKQRGYIVWGVDDATHKVVGTTFKPRQRKVGNEELESWLSHLLHPRLDFRIHEFDYEGKPVVVFEVPAAEHTPVRFRETESIRVGTYKKKLKDYPEKERALWAIFRKETFEEGIAVPRVTEGDVLDLLDYPSLFSLLKLPLPDNRAGIMERLVREKVVRQTDDGFDITNLGAILFARQLDRFDSLARKAVRVVLYKGNDRTQTVKEHPSPKGPSPKGYAVGFEELVNYINDQLPQNEAMGRALRGEVRMYPEIAVRELVANAIIHQDFAMTGTGPMVEIFLDRIEITNPGTPLIDTLRFIDEPPQSRNEMLAALMRRLNICEERGSGIDKVIVQVELFQLPAPDFQVTTNHTRVVLYAPRKFAEMDKGDRLRACYQHAGLCWVMNKPMTNATLRERLGIAERNYPMVSRVIGDAVRAGLIKPAAPNNRSRKHARYVPFWA